MITLDAIVMFFVLAVEILCGFEVFALVGVGLQAVVF